MYGIGTKVAGAWISIFLSFLVHVEELLEGRETDSKEPPALIPSYSLGARGPGRYQPKAHSFVSGPAACRAGKESRIFATSMAHKCPKTLLYQSGERPLRSARQM